MSFYNVQRVGNLWFVQQIPAAAAAIGFIVLIVWFAFIGNERRQEELCHGPTVDESVYYICDQQGFERYLTDYSLEADIPPKISWEGRKVNVEFELYYTSSSADQNMGTAMANSRWLIATVSASGLADSLDVTVRAKGVKFMELYFSPSLFENLPKESTHAENLSRIDELIEEGRVDTEWSYNFSELERLAETSKIRPNRSCKAVGCLD